jgi:hypothetical protein
VLSLSSKFVTSVCHVELWFGILNADIFDHKLTPFKNVFIKDMEDWWGCVCYYPDEKNPDIDIYLHTEFNNKWHFINILGHEMVHKWQIEINHDTGNHNKHFYSWRPKFIEMGLDLNQKG